MSARKDGSKTARMDYKARLKMSFVGQVLRRKDFSCDLSMGSVCRNRGRGRPKGRYSDSVKEIAGIKVM